MMSQTRHYDLRLRSNLGLRRADLHRQLAGHREAMVNA